MTSTNPAGPDPAARPKRRTFSPEYKLRIVAEYDAAPKNEKGAVLRRERLYHSHVKEWRAARDAGALEKLVDKRTSPARRRKPAAEAENEKLRRPRAIEPGLCGRRHPQSLRSREKEQQPSKWKPGHEAVRLVNMNSRVPGPDSRARRRSPAEHAGNDDILINPPGWSPRPRGGSSVGPSLGR
ncbi:hypothetical protein [Streptomyces triticirhizae]|uniref:hypothetical protein n=1 Tax=Streptomyces triticirhizae TaxID=2483353 RepID=UPI00268F113C